MFDWLRRKPVAPKRDWICGFCGAPEKPEVVARLEYANERRGFVKSMLKSYYDGNGNVVEFCSRECADEWQYSVDIIPSYLPVAGRV